MPYTPLQIANSFVAQFGNCGGISHMKLQKLVFYSYGWWLAYDADPLMNEGPEVWKFGPVFSSLYNVMSPFGSNPFTATQRDRPFVPAPLISEEDNRTNELISWVWDRYGGLSSFTLSDETHKPGTPWQTEAAKYNYCVPLHHKIPDAVIKDYFSRQAQGLHAAA